MESTGKIEKFTFFCNPLVLGVRRLFDTLTSLPYLESASQDSIVEVNDDI